ncbi:PREDICTED: beta-2-glycoprotein 1-like [Thamnophis sirtalis]|uniref:Beta-2-glycoprotein 1 n=1 Tax=Thamnophis sirtalis TaxID=35019 RepID=A0A6I9YA51_9SAUR|nr:PREDICTED: beta-2-glycoprotein 1-like [Thamnophis sirtalis]
MFPVLFSLCLVGITHVALANKVCPRPPEVPLATINVNKEAYSPGEDIIYQCIPGYIPQSSSRRYICHSSGKWPTVTFRCTPKKCPYPGPLNNGEIHVTDLNYLSIIRFSCNTGFVLEGPTSSQCQADGSWNASLPACQPVICPPPPVSEFGALSYHRIESGEDFFFQETIRFSCLLPLALFGSETATCQADGSWTALPECKSVECPPPEPIEHGFINFGLRGIFHYQNTVHYGCYAPYTMDEASESRCEKTGTWSNKPTCKAPCNIPVGKATVLYNGQKITVKKLKHIQHAETIWYFCKSKTEKCSYKTPTQCIDGQLSVPDCFEEYNWIASLFKTDPADMTPCTN